jgi:hypothetical protein
MKKTRDKRFGLSRETIRELTTPEDRARVAGGGSCNLTPSTHAGTTIACVPGD